MTEEYNEKNLNEFGGMCDSISWLYTDSCACRIETLADLFVEWYLYDNDGNGGVPAFLRRYDLESVFTPEQFVDLMSGDACLDADGIEFIHAKLPFCITRERALSLNVAAADAYVISIPHQDMIAVRAANEAAKKQKVSEYNREYRKRNLEKLREKDRLRYRENGDEFREKRNAAARARRLADLEKARERARAKYAATREASLARSHRYYHKNREEILAKYHAKYQKDSSRYRATTKKYYETHREKCVQNAANAYAKRLEHEDVARNMCPVFKFICNVKKNHRDVYLTQFKYQESIVNKAWKHCAALRKNNYKICPVCGWISHGALNCPMSRAFQFPDAYNQIANYVAQIKNKSR